MSKPTVAFAADHAGFELKNLLRDELKGQGYPVVDLGTLSAESVDYPDFGRALGEAVSRGDAQFGVAVCGSGIGISIAANRIPGCRAALVHDSLSARLSRQHNDANVIALGARLIGVDTAKDCLKVFLETPFEGGRHARRVAKLGESAQ
ncbi:MAG TPA: ribose 5-phosphate isomerase B [Ferrovibrio sp.]|jgi:ribose 5-phosphate isomerase B|uniref:ribose 5-phosphate isomerase B n=1 Tax=Ferrovibrio sp. TaxID=1917215 RepID=UPI002B4B5510|nr:ribose 5-phosphate isomerase B [Ferrovibrio sp.]HLT78042.1 ribose 5-phosphate isomerase B [Ferrovibrio sp.]